MTALPFVAWVMAATAMAVSLYYSEVQDLVPCLLCWYQRIAMYPLVAILAVGIWRQNRELPYYVLPLSLAGLAIAVYHYLLQQGVIAEALAPCQAGVSCTTKDVIYFGFVTIPLLSALAFLVISGCMVLYYVGVTKRAKS